jgi:hypothetical protein
MKTNLKPSRPTVPDQVTDDAAERNDLTRRDGTIRGVMLSTKTANSDRVFGLAKPTEDFSF